MVRFGSYCRNYAGRHGRPAGGWDRSSHDVRLCKQGAVAGMSDFLIESRQKKPVVACLSAPPGIWDDQVLGLEKKGALLNLPTPERAARSMANLWEYKTKVNRGPYESNACAH